MPTSAMSDDLEEIDQRHDGGRRAEALEGGDGGALGIEEGAHRIGDADAADDQRGQADQRQELREAVDVVGERRGGAGRWCGSTSRPAGNSLFGACRGSPAVGDRCRQLDLVGVFDQAAGLHQPGGLQRLRG